MSTGHSWDDAELIGLQRDLLHFARIQTGNADAAEDITQEALLSALRHRDRFEGRQFQSVFQACLYGLPENTARVFMLREVMGWEAGEIQSHCAISAANYYTIMHRAREGLRQCLQIKWFNHR